VVATFQTFLGVRRVGLEEASKGKEALAMIPKSINKQNIMSNTNQSEI